MKKIVYTDLDGTLLSAIDYSWKDSLQAIEKLKSNNITLIFNSSKTFDEMFYYQQQLNLHEPFIFENGSGIAIPENYFSFEPDYDWKKENFLIVELGVTYDYILEKMTAAFKEIGITIITFDELPPEDLAIFLNLPENLVKKAINKNYSVTILNQLDPAEITSTTNKLKSQNIALQQGSRFITATSSTTDKGVAVKKLNEYLEKENGRLITFAIGDSYNDIPMFIACDHAMQVADIHGNLKNMKLKEVEQTSLPGPMGFAHFAEKIATMRIETPQS